MKYISSADVWAAIPVRGAASHKGDYGKALIVAGCSEYRGAAALACLGALRAGAGLVTLASGEAVIASVASRILEATFLPLTASPADIANSSACPALLEKAAGASAVLIGCGMPETADTAALVQALLPVASGAVILDAGGLCSIKDALSVLQSAKAPLIITPHVGEMAKLSGKTVAQVNAARAEIASAFAMQHNTIVVLKSHRTLIAAPDGALIQNTTGNAGLARGGAGDVLAGIIAGLCAIGLAPYDAAMCGVYLHGLAADLCAARLSMQGMLPEDILADLCGIFSEKCR
ncbi:MAG: NAD(P)H-hydrate dehydratase [Oscillospiraceae bacterium]|nr:NAD(P)H-hydrate dehydratase [Oscillospiraceae bacterium]